MEDAHAHDRAAADRLDGARERAANGRTALSAWRESQLAQLDAEFVARHGGAANRLAEVGRMAAPGASGSPWPIWCPDSAGRGALPGLYRIGMLGPELPALVPLLDLAHIEVRGGSPAVADGLVAGLLLRAIGSVAPGAAQVRVYDPERLGSSLAGFAALAGAGLLRFTGPAGLAGLLSGLVDDIQRITGQVLAGEHPTVRELARTTGRRPEPWRIAVLLAGPGRDSEMADLDRIVRTGLACGVHVIARDIPLQGAVTVHLGQTRITTSVTGDLPVTLDPAPPALLVTRACRELAAGPPPVTLLDLLPDNHWTESSAAGLSAPIGEGADGRPVAMELGDNPPHALIGGPSGSGKTNLIYALLASLTARYSPDELELYLLDFKEGVSFARFAASDRDPSWLPQVRLVGVNVNNDREFGLALLRFLLAELRRRAAAAKRHDATKLAELRVEDPAGRWPRIVVVIDEFQVLLAGRDAMTEEAVGLLEDLARRGRSQGIHLVLASQDVAGIEALWGRPGLVGQFTLRVALPKARRILTETNTAADTVARFHAVVNADSGAVEANQVVRLPDAGAREAWQELKHELWRWRAADAVPPKLFDGDAVPPLPDLPRPTAPPGVPEALLGQAIDVAGRPARMAFGRAPGRNLAVLGTWAREACAVLGAAGRSLGAQCPDARFTVLCLDSEVLPAARALACALPDAQLHDAGTAADALRASQSEPPSDQPHFIIGYVCDAAPIGEALRGLLSSGPERRVHVLGWWRGVSRLRDCLGGLAARFDPIGAWVALDVHGAELSPLCPQPGGPAWYPRPRRALFFDRSVHRSPEVVIPYGC
jgi:hypothetical protein